jgi:hypothetical protein
MNNIAAIHVGYTNDEQPKVIIGIGDVTASLSPYDATRLVTNLKSIVRKIKRATWRSADED